MITNNPRLEGKDIVRQRSFQHNGMKVLELIIKEPNGFTLSWIREPGGHLKIDGKKNPFAECNFFTRKEGDSSMEESARKRVREVFDAWWSDKIVDAIEENE